MRILLINPSLPPRRSDKPEHFLQLLISEEQARINRALFERYTRPKYAELGITRAFHDYPRHTASLGLLSIAATLRQAGHQVDYVQLDQSGKNISEVVARAGEYDIVGITALCTNIDVAVRVLGEIKKAHGSRVHTVIGGPEVSEADSPGDLVGVDFLVRGEGEWVMPELVSRIASGASLDGLAGVRVHTNRGLSDAAELIELTTDELQRVPVPALDLIGDDPDTQLYLQFSRGCDYHCRFCSEGPGTRYLSRTQIEANLRALESYRQNNLIFVVDANFGGPSSKKFVEEFEQAVTDSGTTNYFYVQTRVNRLTKEKLQRLHAARVVNFFFGIESTSDDVLEVCNKRSSWDEILDGLRCARDFYRDLGYEMVPYRANFIQGLPGESAETAIRDLERRAQLLDEGVMASVHDNMFHPVPGSPFYQHASDFDIELPARFRTGLRWSLPNFETPSMSRIGLLLHHMQMRQSVNDALIEKYDLREIARETESRFGGSATIVVDDRLERC